MTARTIHNVAAVGFERAGAEYERGRPGYPTAAVSLLAQALDIGPARDVVDLAAGTGKLTRSLTALGAQVVAVEPVAGMREHLVIAAPDAKVLEGTAENLPLADGSADVVVVAQAFHWFEASTAAREIHRALRPGGGLGVVWNKWDESIAWVASLQAAVHAHAGQAPRNDTSDWRQKLAATGLFSELEERTFPHLVIGDMDALLARIASVSYISALGERERRQVLAQVQAILAADPDTRGRDEIEMPYRTHVVWCHARE